MGHITSSASPIFKLIQASQPSRLAAGADWGAVHDLPGLDWGPLVTLDPDADGEETRQEGNSLDTHLLAVVHLGLGGPVQELNNVLGHLGGGSGGAVLVLDDTVEEDTAHGDTYNITFRLEMSTEPNIIF